MDYTSSGGNVVSGYGDTIASTAGPTSNMDSLMTFGASASNTTPAGIYTGGYILVATGAF
jgi:hypothetical protein